MHGSKAEYRIPRTMRIIAAPVRCILKLLVAREMRNVQHLPAAGGVIFCGNHVSSVDPVLYAWSLYDYGVPFKFLAKDSMFSWPLVGSLMRNLEQIPVARGTKDAARSLVVATNEIKAGKPIIIFPEGTLTKDTNLWPMRGHTGAAKIALTSGAPVIPMAQWGQHQILSDGGKIPKFLPRKKIVVSFGAPVDLEDLREGPVTREILQQATLRIMAAVTDLVAEIRQETPPEQVTQWPAVTDRS